MAINSTSPIGVFDSGLGGLTVLKALHRHFPNESFIYFGDTAHVPYGTRSEETVQHYSREITKFLVNHDVKMVVIACNTASSVALPVLEKEFDIPIFGVVKPSVQKAIELTLNGKIGVIGTRATINSHVYLELFQSANHNLEIFEKSCPLFVPLIEEGWSNTIIAEQIAQTYLEEIKQHKIDTLVLGCTHYPIIENTISKIFADKITFVESGDAVAETISQFMNNQNIQNKSSENGNTQYFVTDYPQKFDELGSQFLGKQLSNIELISLMV